MQVYLVANMVFGIVELVEADTVYLDQQYAEMVVVVVIVVIVVEN